MTSSGPHRQRRWLRVLVGVVFVVVPIAVARESLDALRANHPAYPISLVMLLVAGVLLVGTGWRTRSAPKPGVTSRIERSAAAVGGLALAGTLLWLQPAVATDRAMVALTSDQAVTITDSRTQTVYEPAQGPDAGFVLYPGAKVDPRAYAVIARGIAEDGYRVVVPKCAFDIELLCQNVAERSITQDLPWAVGGHSLGGVAASSFASGGAADGLILLASYPVSDLSGVKGLDVVSISGSNDGLSTPADIEEHRDLLPKATRFVEIEGAVHSFFGDYGPQAGDGEPTISREAAQRRIISEATRLLAMLSDSAT